MTIEELQEKFRNDKSWNTLEANGSHRFDKEIEWIGNMLRQYAKDLGISEERVVELAEKSRSYSWPNYYQEANFPGIKKDGLIGVFETGKEYGAYANKHFKGYRCPQCGTVSPHAQSCTKCDWKAYGLFRANKHSVIILENGLEAIPIFEPVLKGGKK